jgi:hypothetical protein
MNRRERRAQWQTSHRVAAESAARPASRSAVGSVRPVPGVSAPRSVVRLEIGEFVLRGFEKRHSSRIAAAFERSLDERLRGGSLPASLRHSMRSASLRLAPLTLRRSSDPVAIGEQLAASVFAFERDTRRRGGSR